MLKDPYSEPIADLFKLFLHIVILSAAARLRSDRGHEVGGVDRRHPIRLSLRGLPHHAVSAVRERN